MSALLPGFLSRHDADSLVATGKDARKARDLIRDVDAIARALPADIAVVD